MCSVLELLSQLEAVGMLQRQEHKWMVGTRGLGTIPADVVIQGCSYCGDGIVNRQRSDDQSACVGSGCLQEKVMGIV